MKGMHVSYIILLYLLSYLIITVLLPSDLARLQHIFAWKQLHKTGIKLQEFQRGDDYRILWKRISNSREKFVLLDCSTDILVDVINASIGFNMTGSFNVRLSEFLSECKLIILTLIFLRISFLPIWIHISRASIVSIPVSFELLSQLYGFVPIFLHRCTMRPMCLKIA